MILISHLLFGAVITLSIPFLALGSILALLSHYILDAVPHWDYPTPNIKRKRWSKAIFDFLKVWVDFFSGILIIILLSKNWWLGLTGAFFAVLPDIATFFYILSPKNKVFSTHHYFHSICHWHRQKKIPIFFLTISEVTLIILSILVLLKY